MMTNTTSFTKKLILGVFVCVLIAIFSPLVVLGAEYEGNHLTENHIFSFDNDGKMWLQFLVKTSFVNLWFADNGNCAYNNDLFTQSDDFSGASKIALILYDLDFFIDKDCQPPYDEEIFVAGNTYKVYLIDNNNRPSPNDTEADLRAGKIRDMDTEPSVDRETLLDIRTIYEGDGYWEYGIPIVYVPNITINYPADEAEVISKFTMEIEFDEVGSYEKLMILFEDWHASSTCPIYGTDQWEEEYSKWFNYQSLPYFSDSFTTSTGTTTIEVSDLASGIYNCVRCYAINETTQVISEELCLDYNISVLIYVPPEEAPTYYVPITEWGEYYAEHSERFTTSTPLFTKIAGVFEPIISWVGSTALSFQSYFNPDVAKEKGAEMGNAIPIARGYVENIDDFFGGLPISGIFIFYIITALVIFVYRLVKGILTIIIP